MTRITLAAGIAAVVVSGTWLVSLVQPAVRPQPGNWARRTPVELSGNGGDPKRAHVRVADSTPSRLGSQSLLTGWPIRRLWVLGLGASVIVAAIDAALGHRVILVGLLIVGPCCVLLTGRWVPTALTGLWVISLAVILGLPDGLFGTAIFFTWLTAVAVVALVSSLAAAVVETFGPGRLR